MYAYIRAYMNSCIHACMHSSSASLSLIYPSVLLDGRVFMEGVGTPRGLPHSGPCVVEAMGSIEAWAPSSA